MFPLPGSPSLARSDPSESEDFTRLVEEGDNTFFYVEALTHPAAQFQWRRLFSNGSYLILPSLDTDTSSILTLDDVTVFHIGRYSVSAVNAIGHWEDIVFQLLPLSESVFLRYARRHFIRNRSARLSH
jgi:hypothetical protein